MSCVRFFRPAKRFPTVSVHFFPSQMPFAQIVGRQIIPKFLWCLHALSPRNFSRGCQWSTVFSRPLMKPLGLLVPCSLGARQWLVETVNLEQQVVFECGNGEAGVPMFCGEFKRVVLSWFFCQYCKILQGQRFYKFYSFRKQSRKKLQADIPPPWPALGNMSILRLMRDP